MNKPTNRINKAETGQSMVEFALMFVVLMITLMGVFDIGRAYYALIALQDAVGEGAAFAAMNPTCVTASSGAQCADPNNIIWRTKNASPAGMVSSDSIRVQVMVGDVASGSPITVTSTYSHSLVTFVIGSIVGSNVLPLQAQASTVIQ